MLESFALFSIVYRMGFVLVFDRMHWRRKHCWQFWAPHLMSQDESEQILRILQASNS